MSQSTSTTTTAPWGTQRSRSETLAAGLLLGLLSVGGALAFLDFRRRRATSREPREAAELRQARELIERLAEGAEHLNHHLGVIRGCCEVAKMKDEHGEALSRRMDAAIETVAETSALLQQLLAAGRRQRGRSPSCEL